MKKGTKIIIIIAAVIASTGIGTVALKIAAPETFNRVFHIAGDEETKPQEAADNTKQNENDGAKNDLSKEDDITGPSLPVGNDAVKDDEAGTEKEPSTGKETAGAGDFSDLFAMYASSMAETPAVESISLPRTETELSFELAQQALTLCSGGTKNGQAGILMNSGFDIVLQDGYDKSADDVSHTCAFTVGKKVVDFYGTQKTLLVVAVRGTSGAEWFSNFDYADSHTDESKFAENFLEAAQVISIKLIPVIAANPDPLILVCGHSRGAAAANLLGMTLTDSYGGEGIYVYTFATPNTYRGDVSDLEGRYGNIFNFINPADVVTEVPLKAMGYTHVGIDITLPAEPETIQRIAEAMEILYTMSPSIDAYYNVRHSLTQAGLSEDGYTAYEIMQALASSLTGLKTDINGGLSMKDIYEIMDSSSKGSESDFAPLVNQLAKIIERDGTYGVSIFMQHMPATYAKLIEAYSMLAANGPGALSGSLPDGLMGDITASGNE